MSDGIPKKEDVLRDMYLLRAEHDLRHESYQLGEWIIANRYPKREICVALMKAAAWIGFTPKEAKDIIAPALECGTQHALLAAGGVRVR